MILGAVRTRTASFVSAASRSTPRLRQEELVIVVELELELGLPIPQLPTPIPTSPFLHSPLPELFTASAVGRTQSPGYPGPTAGRCRARPGCVASWRKHPDPPGAAARSARPRG